jgi:RNA polymerase sigma factor (sigma-70 family)
VPRQHGRLVIDHSLASDERLAALAGAGDAAAFETLVGRYLRPLFNFAYRLLGDYEKASDVAQETLIRLYALLPSRASDLPLRPLVYRIARNRAIDLMRERRTLPFSDLARSDDADDSPVDLVPDPTPLPDDLVERGDLQRVLGEAIAALPDRYRPVVALRYTTDLTFAEIATALDLPENTAKTFFQRAKALLRQSLRTRV